ncbi:hypothetical protein F4825DRAFT_450489 [Nemania diffusa]|nr:hypothetical protein F4825DRAFT_450489 [Nemania diffusa]
MKTWMRKWWRSSNRSRGEQSAATSNAAENQSIAGDVSDYDEDNASLKVLYNPTDSNLSTEADIIFIHGLGGHREETWTAREPETERPVLWIKDFLPDHLPHARIITYGYSSQIVSVKHLTQRTLYSQSKILLSALKRFRQDVRATGRPIIFIAHSLGGLIVKSALIYADKDDHIFNDIRICTAGVVFFGTPHQGTPSTSWTKLVSDLIRPQIDLNTMLNTLDADLNWLQFQLEQYKSLEGFFHTCCVYEDETFQINSRVSTVIPRVAAIPPELLNTTTLLTAARRQLHQNLCKFQSRDSEYQEAVQHLRTMYERSRDVVSRNIFLDQLRRDPFVANNDGDSFRIPVSLPQDRVKPFLGRDIELRAIHDRLSTQQSKRTMTLLGPPGIGKTQIALEYAYAYQSNYSSVFWVDAQNRSALLSSILKFAEQLKNQYVITSRGEEERLTALHHLNLGGLIDEGGQIQSCQDSPELLFLVLRKWLERRGNDEWLLIVDGMDRETDLRDFQIDEFLDSQINGHIIITGRSLRRGQTLNVQALQPYDAKTLLCQTARLKDTPDSDILELADKLGGVPLAIKQAGAFLLSSQWSAHKYSEVLSLDILPDFGIAPQYWCSPLPNMWSISIQQLDKKTVELLDMIAFLSNTNISVEFIKSGVQELLHSTPRVLVDESLTTLKEYSLIRYDLATQTVALLSCMPEWLRESKKNTPDDYKFWARMACSCVSSYLKYAVPDENSTTYTAKQYQLEEQLLPYIERCVDYIQVLSPHEADWGTWADICRRQGRHDLAKQYYGIVIYNYKQMPLRAEVMLRDMHDIESALGPAHIRTLNCAVLLASQYQAEDEHAKAEIIWRRAKSSQSKKLGDFHPWTLKTEARLAMALQQQGNYREAKAIYSSTCKATATILGEDHPDSLKLMVNVAVLCTLQRHFDEADREYKKVLRKMEAKLGHDHEDVKRVQELRIRNNKLKRTKAEGATDVWVCIYTPFTPSFGSSL